MYYTLELKLQNANPLAIYIYVYRFFLVGSVHSTRSKDEQLLLQIDTQTRTSSFHMNFFLSLSYLSSAALNSFTHPLYNKYGTPTPKIAITPTVLGEKRKVLSTTSRAWPWSSTNWFGFTDVGSAPAIIIISSLSSARF